MSKIKDFTGKKFGRLKVINFSHRDTKTYWNCLCDCGKKTLTRGDALTGGTKSCGCLTKDTAKNLTGIRFRKHSKWGSEVYHSWANMKQRCNNPNHPRYKDYGGRGITICKRWHEFKNFYEDMGDRPEGKSIDRINNNGNYEPGNCKWSTPTEQNNNKG